MAESVKFGENFELNLRAYELRRAGRALKLERIPMDLLVLLVQRRGELVSRERIIEKIWGKDVFLDTDASINSAIRKIRQTLKDDPDQPRFVQTVSGRGYRFIAPLEEAAPASRVAPPTTAPDTLLGKKVSHYRVLQMLGGGGMGVVYKAEDLKLGRLVALKFLPSEVSSDQKAFARLQQEARAASALDHPNICSIYQLGEHEGQPFIVMQFLEGHNLRDWIEKHAGRNSEKRVQDLAEIGIQVASGLEAAHEKGLIHRDIKPANIFITTRGQAKILDFGVAKFLDAAEGQDEGTKKEESATASTGLHLTRTGAALGTPSYLSPEQVRHEKLDTRSDLFSFGLVLYEMATGQRAFSGNTAAEIRDAVLAHSPPPPRQVDPKVPAALEKIITKSLEKDRDKRYQSAADLVVDLEGVVPGVRPEWKRNPWVWTAFGVALVAVSLFAFTLISMRGRIFSRSQETSSFKTRRSVAVLGFKNLSGRDDQAWISTALAEMLGAELASGQQLRVVPGESVARMRVDLSLPEAESYAQDTLGRIKSQLNNDLVLHGSYLALGKDSGGRIRINLQLQDTRAGETIAVVLRDGSESDLASLVAQSGASLREKLGVGEVSSSDASHLRSVIPSSPEAAALYAEGLAKLRTYDALAARDLLERAIAIDSKHALSYAVLADAWYQLGYDGKAQESAKKAVDLSAGLSREDQLAVEGRYREAAHEWPRAIEVYRMLWEFFPDNLDYGLHLAKAQASGGFAKDAMTTVESLAKRPAPAGSDPRVDLVEAIVSDALGDLRREEAAAARAAEKGRRQGARILTAQALLTRGSVLGALGDRTNAVPILQEAQAIFSAVGDQGGVARALTNLGSIARYQSKFDEARKLMEQSLEICRRIGFKVGMGKTLNNLGNLYWEQGDTTHALEAFQQSLNLAREIGEKNREVSPLNNMAGLLTLQGRLADAQKMYEQSLALSRELGDQEGVCLISGNIADVLTRKGDLVPAKKMGEEATATCKQNGNMQFEGYAQLQLGTVLALQGDVTGGRARYQQAVQLRREMGEKVTEAEGSLAIAQLLLDTGDFAGAEAEAKKLTPIFHGQTPVDDEALSQSVEALALVGLGKPQEAQRAIAVARQLAPKAVDLATRIQVEIADSYISGAAGNGAVEALRKLETTRQKAARQGYYGLELEARLRIAQLELHSGRAESGRANLAQLQNDARAKGFLLLARKAKAASGR